jgi:Flp pilus assembly protein TadG
MKPMNKAPRSREEHGGAVVESAFIFLVFFLLLLGSFDFGQFLFIHATLTERARAAVRYGAVNDPTNAAAIQNMVLYGQPTGGTGRSTDAGSFNVLRSNVTATATGVNTQDYRLTVKIQNYTYKIYSPYIHGTYTGPIIVATLPLGINF